MALPNSAGLERILAAFKQLAEAPAFLRELEVVVAEMGDRAFRPAPLVDADGEPFELDMEDRDYDGNREWVSYPGPFKQVLTTQQLRPVPPYPLIQFLGEEGVRVPDTQVDQAPIALYQYTVDSVIVIEDSNPDAASRRALAYSDAFERLVRRNEHLGGLVYLIDSDGPPVPGGEVETTRTGVLSACLQRFHVRALRMVAPPYPRPKPPPSIPPVPPDPEPDPIPEPDEEPVEETP